MLKRMGWALLTAGLMLVTATPAIAQVAASNKPEARGLLLRPLTLTRIQDLNFGSLIPSDLPGSVSINASTGARTTFGGVAGLPSVTPQRALFAGVGTAGQQVLVMVVPPLLLTNTATGDTIDVLAMPMDGPPIRSIAPDRTFHVGVGGIISVAANQPEGLYSAEFEVLAQYQ